MAGYINVMVKFDHNKVDDIKGVCEGSGHPACMGASRNSTPNGSTSSDMR